jgi:hypothetical protein
MPIETEPNPHRIETGRSWRDLPPQPPTTAPLRRQVIDQAPAETVRRTWPWGRIAAGAVALVVGISVGVWAPWSGTANEESQPLAADERLPDTIVPDPPQEFQQDPAPLDEPFVIPPDAPGTPQDFFEQLPEDFFEQIPDEFLDQFPDGFFDGIPGAGAVQPDGLIELADLPDGYQARSNVFSESNDRASQRIRLLGPSGAVDVQAIRGPGVSLPESGEPFAVAGAVGRLTTTGEATTLSWLADNDLLITVEAGPDVDLDLLWAIAEAVEVSE